MKTYRILLGNGKEFLNDFIESLFHEVCQDHAAIHCTRTPRVDEFIQAGCGNDFDLIIAIPHYLTPESNAPIPMAYLGEGIRAIRTIKSNRPASIIAIVASEERTRYEPLFLEAGADCVLELPFEGEQLASAVSWSLRLPSRLDRFRSKPWFFAGVLMRGLRLLCQAEMAENALFLQESQ